MLGEYVKNWQWFLMWTFTQVEVATNRKKVHKAKSPKALPFKQWLAILISKAKWLHTTWCERISFHALWYCSKVTSKVYSVIVNRATYGSLCKSVCFHILCSRVATFKHSACNWFDLHATHLSQMHVKEILYTNPIL